MTRPHKYKTKAKMQEGKAKIVEAPTGAPRPVFIERLSVALPSGSKYLFEHVHLSEQAFDDLLEVWLH